MTVNTLRGLSTRARTEALTENERVTARIVLEEDGTTHHEYHAGGRVYTSLEELNAAQGELR